MEFKKKTNFHVTDHQTSVVFTSTFAAFILLSEMFAFVLTGEDGSRRFGYCRRLLVNNSPINERTATGQEVAEYHNDS